MPMFQRNILPPSSPLKKEAIYSFRTLVSSYNSTWLYNQEDQHQHLHCREKSRSSGIHFMSFCQKICEFIFKEGVK
jgi:hypothetical protein